MKHRVVCLFEAASEIREFMDAKLRLPMAALYDTKSECNHRVRNRVQVLVKEEFRCLHRAWKITLERIYKLIEEKGYARVSDIAEGLEVHPSSVTKMIQKLDKDQYLIYEKYRGLVLTSKGKKMGKRLVERHHLLEEFLQIIGVQEENIYQDVEGIEHHLSWDSITCIETLVEFFKRDEVRVETLRGIRSELDTE